jgi:hypothetical protein
LGLGSQGTRKKDGRKRQRAMKVDARKLSDFHGEVCSPFE